LYPHKDFTSLTAWSKARTVKQFFYKKVLPKLPLEERFSIGEQIRRASVSCTAVQLISLRATAVTITAREFSFTGLPEDHCLNLRTISSRVWISVTSQPSWQMKVWRTLMKPKAH
jgi:hypothetical protein